MATVTDLTGSSVSQADLTSVQVGKDSNINVYEFGNLLLAGILPRVSSWLKNLSDRRGAQLSATDRAGRVSFVTPGPILATEDLEDITDEEGIDLVIEGIEPGTAVANSIVDISGS